MGDTEMPENHGQIIVTLRDIWDQQLIEGQRIAKIETALELMTSTIQSLALSNKHLSELDVTLARLQAQGAGENHERRISSLERWRSGVVAIGVFVGAASGVVAALIAKVI